MILLESSGVVQRELVRFYDKGFDWILTAGPRIIFAIIVLSVGLWFIRLLRRKLDERMRRRNVHSSLQPFFSSLFFTALHVALIFIIMEIVGIKLTVFAAVIAAFGAAAGLALSGTLQNFASGVLILLLKPFKVGDNIIAQGFEGTVTSIQIFYTIITTFDNKTVIMPNSKLSNEVITNITLQGVRRMDVELKFNHDKDIDEVRNQLLSMFSAMPEVSTDTPPRVGISAISKDEYTVTVNLWLNSHGFEDARLKINEQIKKTLYAPKSKDDKQSDVSGINKTVSI